MPTDDDQTIHAFTLPEAVSLIVIFIAIVHFFSTVDLPRFLRLPPARLVWGLVTRSSLHRADLESLDVVQLKAVMRVRGIRCDSLIEKTEIVDVIISVQESIAAFAAQRAAAEVAAEFGNCTPSAPFPSPNTSPKNSFPRRTFFRVGSGRSNSMPKKHVMECGVCYEGMGGESGKPAATSKCGHLACKSCWDSILSNSKKCHICRKNVSQSDIVQIYY